MPTITGCIRKAGAALQTEDKDAILERFNALTKDGTAAAEAARQAIDEQIAAVRAMLEPGANESQAPKERAEAMAAKGQPVHQDPGEAPEVATKAVVTEAVKTAAENRDRKPSEMRAELLRMVDEAIPRAKDSTDQDVRVYEATAVGTRMTEAEQAEYKRLGTGQPRDKYMQRLAKDKAALHERAAERIGFVTFKVPGDGTFRLLNTVNRLKAFRTKVESSPGFKDRQAPLESPRVNGYGMRKDPGSPFGVERGSGGPKAVIENMVDDGDPQAAVDYAAARGLDVAEVLKGDKVRLPKVAGLTPTAEAVGEFEPEVAPEPAAPAQPEAATERFAAGQALTKTERKQVLDSLVDVYKAKGAPREQKGIGRDGNERYGYVHSPELFEKSDITGAMVRYYVTLPDGRRAHPSELFPDYTQSDIDAEMAAREARKRDRASDVQRATVPAQQFSTIREAVEWWDKRSRESTRTATGLPTIFPSEERRPLTNGSKFILVPNATSGELLEAFADAGWQVQRADQPAAASAAPPAQQAEPSAPAPAADDPFAALFGTPAEQEASQQRLVAQQQAERQKQDADRADIERLRKAIAGEKKRAQAEYDDWSSRVYKANKTQVDLQGDGPSNQASMSIGAINESRRRNAMEALAQEMRALDKLDAAMKADAAKVMRDMRGLLTTASRIAADGTGLFKTADEQFQYMLLDDLKFRGPGGKGNVTSNGLSKAMLAAINPSAPAPSEPTTLAIEMGGSTLDVDLGKPVWQATEDEVQAAVAAAGFSSEKRGKYDPMMAWREAHGAALNEAKAAGKPIPARVLYDNPRLIRDDLSDDQADQAADAMVDVYRATKDHERAVQAYRDFGKTLKQRADSMRRKPEGEPPVFSRASRKLEQERDLLIQHNLTVENLLHAARMGGIPVPSLAVTKADAPLMNFGEVTLIGPQELADPKGYAGTKVFGADIYSPRYPNVTLDFTPNQKRRLEAELAEAMKATDERYIDYSELAKGPRELSQTVPFLWKFAKDNGIKPEVVRTEPKPIQPGLEAYQNDTRQAYELAEDPEFAKAALSAHRAMLVKAYKGDTKAVDEEMAEFSGPNASRNTKWIVSGAASEVARYRREVRDSGKVERYATRNAIENQLRARDLMPALEQAARDTIERIGPNERIFRGFSAMGNRLYTPHTLENVVKILKKELRGGENFNYGMGSLRAKFTPQFKSVKAIREAKDRLVTKEQFEQIKKEMDAEMMALSNSFGHGSLETTLSMVEDAAKMGVDRAAKEYDKNAEVTPEQRQAVYEFIGKLRNLPTEYFEAKVLRDVEVAEFKVAVVPAGMPEKARAYLESRGVKIVTYEKGNDSDRAAKIKQAADENQALFNRARAGRQPEFVSPRALRDEVAKITATWDQDLADVEVVNRVEDLPADIRQAVRNVGSENTVRGLAMPDGRVFLVAENISSLDEGRFVLFHEVYGHVGMRAFLGDGYGLQMRMLRKANPALAQEADRWFKLYGEDEIQTRIANAKMTPAAARQAVLDLAVEEALADRAGDLEVKGWQRIVAALQRGLRRMGLGSVADMLEGMTEAETVDLLVQARRTVQAGQRMRAGEMEPAMSRDAERAALRELSNADEMFALPRSDGKTVEQIAAEIYPSAKVSQLRPDPGQAARYSIEMPSGEVGYLYVRKPNQYGPTVYGFDLKDGDMTNIVEGRPGDNADAIPDDVEDVYIDVSKLKGTGAGQRIYAIAAAYAHNTDRVFIGDPAGLTDEAMRRRAENMLASALRYGTTAHLAPHPRQLAGAAKVGVPPLKWVYGDHIGNIRSLIAVNVQAMQNAGLDDAAISYDLAAGTFRDSSGSPITRAELDVLAKTTYLGDAGVAGSRTLARNALLRSLLREEGRGSTSGGQRDGLLALLAGINRGRPDAVGALFSRRTSQDTLRDVIPPAVQEWITDRTTSQRGFNRGWHRTVGTQLHKAKVNKEFGKAYYAVQDYMKDVSRMATLAADLAPDMLPQIESLGDLARLAPTLASPAAYKQRKADIKAASDALFDGTLRYTRDEDGKAVKVDPDSDELGGLVWTDAELKARGLSDRAIKMYRQSRKAIGQSLDSMLAADLYRQVSVMDPELVASDPSDYNALMAGLRRAAASDTPGDAVNRLQQAIGTKLKAIQTSLDGQPNQHTPGLMQRRQDLRKLQEMIGEKVQRIDDLKAAGYTPLMRFGPYAVDVVNPDGRRVFFGMYESQAAANKAARNFRGDGLKVTQSVMPQKQFEALQGVSPETAMLFAEMLGVEKNEAMQTWLKNAVAEQSALKRHIRRKGIEGFDDDGGRVLAAFITSNARAASRALHSQRISDAVENIQQGDVQDEARALAEYVSNPKEEAQAIRSLLFVQYIGGSIASAIVNLTQTFAQTLPYLSQYGGGIKAGQRVGAAMKLALADKIPDAKLAAAIARAERDGVVKPQEVFQLQAEASRSLGSNLYVRSILAAWGSMFQLAEQFNRRVAFIAAYNTAVEQKIDDPFAFAENAVDETQSVFNKGNRPNWARGAVGATLFTFKTFTIQYVEFLKRLATAGEPGSPERAAGQKAAALALMSIMVMAGSSGLPFADDLDDIIDTVAQGLGYNWTTKLQRDRFLDNLLGETFSGILQHGLSGVPGVPFDVSQRLGMANLLPGTGLLKQSETNKQNQVLEVFGVAGSAVRDATQGQFLPIAIRNIIKGLDTYETGMYRDGRGRNVTEADPLDAALKAIGLQPSVVARAQRDIGMQIEARNLYRAVKEEITDAWAQAQFQGDAEGVKKARDAMRKWNESNPDSRIIVLPQTIQQRVRQMRLSKADRTVANTPRPLRASTAEALQ